MQGFVAGARRCLHMAQQLGAPPAVMTLASLVEAEKCVDWTQAISLTCPKCQGEVSVEDGLDMCCAMFEPELISALQNSTASGGCKWYHRNSYESKASAYAPREKFDVACRFSCSFFKSCHRKEEEDSGSEGPIVRRDSRHKETANCKASMVWNGTRVRPLAIDALSQLSRDLPTQDLTSACCAVLFGFRLPETEDTGRITRDAMLSYVQDHVEECRSSSSVEYMNNQGKRGIFLLFFFRDEASCQPLHGLHKSGHRGFKGNVTAKLHFPMTWRLKTCDTNHTKHFRPRVPWHTNAHLSHKDHAAIAAAKGAGADAAAIINMVTNNGERGLMSYQRLQYVNDCIKSDQEEFKYVPKAGESDAQALINMLSTRAREKKDIRFCYLYTKPETAADAEVFTSMTMVTGHDGQTFSSDGPSESRPATWLSTLRAFASDAWGRVVGVSVHDTEPPPRKKVAKKVWAAEKRKFKVGAHTMLLVGMAFVVSI